MEGRARSEHSGREVQMPSRVRSIVPIFLLFVLLLFLLNLLRLGCS